MTDDDIQIYVHGPTCSHWVEPTKTSDYVVMSLVAEEMDGYTAWRCPMCQRVILELWDHGTIDFGTMDLPEPEPGFLETFENVEPIAEEPDD